MDTCLTFVFFQGSPTMYFSRQPKSTQTKLMNLINDVFEETQPDYVRRTLAEFIKELGKRPIFIHPLGVKIVSFSSIRKFDKLPTLGLLEFTCTAKMYRRKGYGRDVWELLEKYASNNGIDDLFSIVWKKNTARKKMLKNFQFHRILDIPEIFTTKDVATNDVLFDSNDFLYKWSSSVSR